MKVASTVRREGKGTPYSFMESPALPYLCPEEKGAKRQCFSATQAVELYLERGDEIFDVPFWKKVKSVSGLTDESI